MDVLKWIFWFLDVLIPKKRNLIAFSLEKKKTYCDNSRAFFEYLSLKSEWECVWLTSSPEKVAVVKALMPNSTVLYRYSVRGLWLLLRSYITVFGYSPLDFGRVCRNMSFRKKRVQVWHGIPIKYVGALDQSVPRHRIQKIYKKSKIFDLFVCASKIEAYYLHSCVGVEIINLIPTGLPRNDVLMTREKTFISPRLGSDPKWDVLAQKKVILYAPTFRADHGCQYFPFSDLNTDELQQKLELWNAVMLVRPHKHAWNEVGLSPVLEACPNVMGVGSDVVEDITDLMHHVDVVITDYSSVYLDLLLKDVPPVFLPYDLALYEKERGLGYPFDVVTPGPKVDTFSGFLEAIEDALKGAPDYKNHREFVRDLFHQHIDGKACERVEHALKTL